ncbi:ribonuclease H-like domain-containing protein [Halovenus marina]|uniref:ribonuclease H-like domain-containing protein n=1 Tax=Halovenus marina TaxID=3396621 RepID=UPI003F552622
MRVENSFCGAEGIGETIERRLWEQGITEWDAFEPSCDGVGSTRASRIESFIAEGREALAADDIAYFDEAFPSGARWRLYESFRDRACFFDIETTGLDERTSVVTTVSLHQDGETQTLVRGDDLTDERLRAAFADAGLLVTFNGARFDVPFLEHNFDITLDQPHLDLMPTCRKVGLSGGLSAVEDALGIGRELPDVDGREAVRLWHEHERGVDGALDRLIEYNREDTENMKPVLERTVERLDEQVFPARG